MSSDTVMDALVTWLDAPAIPGLNKVYDEAPWFTDGSVWQMALQSGWGSVGFLHIGHEEEHRIAMGGPTGGLKQVTYDMGLVLLFRYLIPSTLDPDVSPTGYRRPLNSLIDGVKARLREDRTVGTAPGTSGEGGIGIDPAGSIIQVGEGDGTSGTDMTITRDLPKRSGGAINLWLLMEFRAVEILVA